MEFGTLVQTPMPCSGQGAQVSRIQGCESFPVSGGSGSVVVTRLDNWQNGKLRARAGGRASPGAWEAAAAREPSANAAALAPAPAVAPAIADADAPAPAASLASHSAE